MLAYSDFFPLPPKKYTCKTVEDHLSPPFSAPIIFYYAHQLSKKIQISLNAKKNLSAEEGTGVPHSCTIVAL